MSDHIVIFSNWFGVRKDERGLFLEIAQELGGYDIECVLFDYAVVDEAYNAFTVKPFNEQAKILQWVIKDARSKIRGHNRYNCVFSRMHGGCAPESCRH